MKIRATSFTVEEGLTVITGETITSRAFMINLLCRPAKPTAAPPGIDLNQQERRQIRAVRLAERGTAAALRRLATGPAWRGRN
jgi:hypothetical protein